MTISISTAYPMCNLQFSLSSPHFPCHIESLTSLDPETHKTEAQVQELGAQHNSQCQYSSQGCSRSWAQEPGQARS